MILCIRTWNAVVVTNTVFRLELIKYILVRNLVNATILPLRSLEKRVRERSLTFMFWIEAKLVLLQHRGPEIIAISIVLPPGWSRLQMLLVLLHLVVNIDVRGLSACLWIEGLL